MDIKKMESVLIELRRVEERYIGRKVDTCEINISAMAKDAADVIEELLTTPRSNIYPNYLH
jgi:hypothetical protein